MPIPLRILILEDQPADAELMLYELRRAGFEPEWLCIDTEAEYLAHLDPALDVILSDYSMPQFDAPHALQILQARGLDIPFVVVTGTVGEELVVECMKQGATDYLLKDRLARLGPVVTRALREKKLREEKWQAEQENEQLREFNESVIQNMAEGIVVEDKEGILTFVNPAAAAMLGYTAGELIGQHWTTIVPADLHPIVQAADERRTRGEVDRYELQLIHRNGTQIPVLVSGSPHFDANTGHFMGSIAVFTDISERAQVEEKLARHAREMAALYDTSLEINSQLDLSTLLHAIVDRAAGLLGMRMGGLYLMEPGNDILELVIAYNLPDHYVGTRLQPGEGLSGRVAQAGEPMMINDYTQWEGLAAPFAGASFRRVLGVPLKVGERIVGVLSLADDEKTGPFDKDEIRLASLFADQAAIAIQNSHLFQETQQRLKELTLLFDTNAAVSTLLDVDEIVHATARQIAAALEAEGCAISLWDRAQDTLVTLVDHSLDPDYWQPDAPDTLYHLAEYPTSAQVLTSRQPRTIQVNDPYADPSEVAWMRRSNVKSLLMVPLVVRDEAIGLLELQETQRERTFTPTEISLCQTLANQAAAALENARLFQETSHRAEQMDTLNRIGMIITSALELDEVLNILYEQVQGIWDVAAFYVALYDEKSGLIEFPLLTGASGSAQLEPMNIHQQPGITGYVIQSRQAVYLPDTWAALEKPPYAPIPLSDSPARSYLGVPLIFRDRVLGALSVQVREPNAFSESDVELLTTIASQATIAIENARLFEETRRRNRELALLNRIIAASTASQQIETILETVCRELALAFGIPRSLAALLSEEGTGVTVVAEYLAGDLPSAVGLVIPTAGTDLAQHLIEQRTPLVVADAQTDPLLAAAHDLMHQSGIISLLILPLIIEEAVVGGLALVATKPRSFSAEEVNLAGRVAEQVSGALARARLEEAQRRLNAAVEQAAEAVMVTDRDSTILYVNPAFERITGRSSAESIGQSPRQFGGEGQEAATHRKMWQVVATGQAWQGQFASRKPDGSTYVVDSTVTPVRNQAGEIVNYVATLRDVTREVQLEEQFRQAQKLEALGRLAGGIAHDFNNMLTVIHLSTRLLQRRLRPEDPLWEYVQRIQETSQRATELTKQLLSFSRREVVEPQVLNLNQVVGDLNRMLQRIIGEDVELATTLADDLWPVKADPSQMEQAIINLAVNARDAMPEGGRLSIETANVILDQAYISAHVDAQPGEHVLLAVSDTGMGIDEELKTHLFEPFFTTKERGEGTGLGLSIVYGTVRRSGGHIEVDSEVGQGTTFRLYLPRAEEAKIQTSPRLSSATAPRLVRGTETVLVAEDEKGVRDLAVTVLKTCGYQVLAAEGGAQALQISKEYDGLIDLLLTDMVMPRMSGRELAEQLQGQRPEMRVMYMSGYTGEAIVQRGEQMPDAILSKPFTIEELTEKLRAVLDGRE